MNVMVYYLILMTPLVFLIKRPRRELCAVAAVIIVFLLINGRFVTGEQTVSWDTLFWSTEFQYLRELVQAGYIPGWNPFFNSGEPLYMYHQHYAVWQWFLFAAIDKVVPVNPVTLFNLSFVFLFIFYNVGCYILFRKIFSDARVALYCLAVSLLSMGFIMLFQEFESLHVIIYFPYIIYFFIEFMEKKMWAALALLLALIGIAVNAYVPNYLVLAIVVFVVSYLFFMEREHLKLPSLNSKAAVYTGFGLILMIMAAIPVFFLMSKWGSFTSPMRTGLEDYMNPVQAVTGHHQEFNAIFSFFTVSSYIGKRAKLFIGLIPIVFAIIGAIKSKNRFHWVVFFSAVVLYFISLGRNSIFYVIVHYLPTFSMIRNYVEFEFFVQFFIICLSGMGLEYILSITNEEKRKTAYIALAVFSVAALFYLGNWYQEQNQAVEPLFSISMYIFLLFSSAGAVMLLIQSRSRNAMLFFWLILVLTLGTAQWYLGYLTYDRIRWSEDSAELEKLHDLLKKDTGFSWNPTRVITAEQKLHVAGSYNTFEPALRGVERAFSEPVDRNLLITKRYYDMRELRKDKFEYFGVDYPKIFLTTNYKIVPQETVLQAMDKGYLDFVNNRTVYFAADDLPKLTEVNALGNLREVYDTGIKQPMNNIANKQESTGIIRAAYAETPSPSELAYTDDTKIALSGSDEFNGAGNATQGSGLSQRGWSVLNSSSTLALDVDKTESGKLVMALDSEDRFFWDGTFNAPYVYKVLTGDFVVETAVSGNAQRDNERAGIIIRDPYKNNLQNWLGILSSSSLGRSVNYVENTVDSKTDYQMRDCDEQYLRIDRRGDVFSFYSKKESKDEWTLRRRFSRSDIGKTVQVGMGAQNNNRTGKYAAAFDWFRFGDNGTHLFNGAAKLGNIEMLNFEPNSASFSVVAPVDSLLVYLQNYDDAWSVYVNGSKTPIRRVNYNFQAVAVPRGKNTVEFRYRSGYAYALALHLAAAVTAVILTGVYLWRKDDNE